VLYVHIVSVLYVVNICPLVKVLFLFLTGRMSYWTCCASTSSSAKLKHRSSARAAKEKEAKESKEKNKKEKEVAYRSSI